MIVVSSTVRISFVLTASYESAHLNMLIIRLPSKSNRTGQNSHHLKGTLTYEISVICSNSILKKIRQIKNNKNKENYQANATLYLLNY